MQISIILLVCIVFLDIDVQVFSTNVKANCAFHLHGPLDCFGVNAVEENNPKMNTLIHIC